MEHRHPLPRLTLIAAFPLLSFLGIALMFANDAETSIPSIRLETGRTRDGVVTLAGRDSCQQIIVTAELASGNLVDQTRLATYAIVDPTIASCSTNGLILPLQEGETTLTARASEREESIKIKVTNLVRDVPISFPNQIVPVFTKYGCNAGGCHGKSGGQNGFRLSLLGFEPKEDYEYLVKESRGRRLFFPAPERSLLLAKTCAAVPHGGGQRLEVDSPAYRLIRRWIEQGAPYGAATDPVTKRIEILPQERILGREQSQQLVVIAHYSDGSTEDVTRFAQFDSQDPEMADIDSQGLVTTGKRTGSVSIMTRFQGQVAVFRGTIPLGASVASVPPEKNFIDRFVFSKLQELGLPPSSICDDATFLRRATIDIAGRIPTLEEVESFAADSSSAKRERAIEVLLESPGYVDSFANKWSTILRNKRRADQDKSATFAFHQWIRDSLKENKPYDKFVRELLTASGVPGTHGPVSWYREVKDTFSQVEDCAQLFLGQRIQCARCHHHPFEKWSQQDYYGFAAFFSRVGRKRGLIDNQDRIFHSPGAAQMQNPKSQQMVLPTGLGSEPLRIEKHQDPRENLADWMADPANPFFAKALVNRYWKHFFGRGLVDPEDDLRVTNPATHPELLAALAEDFVEHHFDLRHVIRTLCNSQTYQLQAEPNEWNAGDQQSFSRFYPRRLNAEVLLDAIDQVTGTVSEFAGAPRGTLALQLPDSGFESYFLTVFGKPEGTSACECERGTDANLAQSLHLLNSKEMQSKLTKDEGRVARMAVDKERSLPTKVRELYLLALGREPHAEELGVAEELVSRYPEDPQAPFEQLVWALLNTKEFLFNH
jgi:hypothetical protein